MDKPTCSISDCGKSVKSRGWCEKHYMRWVRHGDPLKDPARPKVPPEVRFWAKVDKNGPVPDYAPHLGPCWLWTGADNKHGYGKFYLDGHYLPAHQVAYTWLVKPVPDGCELDHMCRVRACVNPAHLDPVTHLENVQRGTASEAQTRRWASMTTCLSGKHPWIPENISTAGDGTRTCKLCRREAERRKRMRRAEQRATKADAELGMLF
jgi:hypothetical protein